VYRDSANAKGPDVRVIWPSLSKDNSQFLKPGTTTARPAKCRVPALLSNQGYGDVKRGFENGPRSGRASSGRSSRQVVLDQDTPRVATRRSLRIAIQFIRGLAGSDPDSFLYNFRDAFGQKQPRRRQAAGRLGQPDHPPARPRQADTTCRPSAPGIRRHDPTMKLCGRVSSIR